MTDEEKTELALIRAINEAQFDENQAGEEDEDIRFLLSMLDRVTEERDEWRARAEELKKDLDAARGPLGREIEAAHQYWVAVEERDTWKSRAEGLQKDLKQTEGILKRSEAEQQRWCGVAAKAKDELNAAIARAERWEAEHAKRRGECLAALMVEKAAQDRAEAVTVERDALPRPPSPRNQRVAMSGELTNKWAQFGHAEQVRRAAHDIVTKGGSEREHALVRELDRLNERVWINDPAPKGVRAMESRIAKLESEVKRLREALMTLAHGLPENESFRDFVDRVSRAALAEPEDTTYPCARCGSVVCDGCWPPKPEGGR